MLQYILQYILVISLEVIISQSKK